MKEEQDGKKVEWQKLFKNNEVKEMSISPKKKTKSKIIYIRK